MNCAVTFSPVSELPVILIPARRASTRLPEKLLLAKTGQPLIAHTCRRAALAFGPDQVVVCADDQDLVAAAVAAGARAKLTSLDHQSGTDRIAEVAATVKAPIYINVQGDEPDIDPEHIRLVADLLKRHAWAGIATLCTPGTIEHQNNPNNVKVVLGANDRALWFTRAPSPWDRDAQGPSRQCLRHLGIYAYRREVLLNYGSLPPSRLEQMEKLEQLRAIEAGIGIACATVAGAAPGIDVQADYDAFVQRHRVKAK